MGFSFTQEFTGGEPSDKLTRCRCDYHSNLLGRDIWVDTDWELQGGQAFRVTATATAQECQADHGGSTDVRTIARPAFENAAPQVRWDFFRNFTP